MNKEVFTQICDRLETVASLRWIDWDSGQLDILSGQRPAIAFPACLIDIAYPTCDDISQYGQIVTANVTIRLIFMPPGETNHKSPVRDQALAVFDVVEAVHNALQGWGSDELSNFSRINAQPEKRKDGLKVYRITYQTAFSETAE
jgi:hypothetical protein